MILRPFSKSSSEHAYLFLCVLLLLVSPLSAFQPGLANDMDAQFQLLDTAIAPRPHHLGASEAALNVFHASSMDAIDYFLKRNIARARQQQKPTLSVLRFHAPYCRACQMVAPKVERLARGFSNVHFGVVSLSKQEQTDSEREAIVKTMQVPALPWGQIWHSQAGLVEELSLNPTYFNEFAAIAQSYRDESCLLPEDIYEETGIYGAPYARKNRAVYELQKKEAAQRR
jgi:thiol-disulfide isomerase/thioredoxin